MQLQIFFICDEKCVEHTTLIVAIGNVGSIVSNFICASRRDRFDDRFTDRIDFTDAINTHVNELRIILRGV